AVTEATEQAFAGSYESVAQDPLNLGGGPEEFIIPMDDVSEQLEKIVVDRGEGAFGEDGSLELGSRFGLVKIIWKHGPKALVTRGPRLTKEEILATPRVLREL
ncbi:MAG: hypothetical protein HQ495_04450, partial [Alphaproteobacteria bacterium]|nr:hypothetical protein [Alphaproteobacteria bacterium]